MLFISVDDFFEKARCSKQISREEERAYAIKMKNGDPDARDKIIAAYLPYVATSIKRLDSQYQTLELVLRGCIALEKAVDKFDFLQDSERFSHRLSWYLRQTSIGYIAEKRSC